MQVVTISQISFESSFERYSWARKKRVALDEKVKGEPSGIEFKDFHVDNKRLKLPEGTPDDLYIAVIKV